ncbi:MAG: zinc-binding dehydrogenase [Alphaproteobacteria bacterium]|nr:zinc-binding dehydrogenase [Alphaproteobacteria bacterium]
MKQVLQNVANGETSVVELPRPQCKAGHVLIRSSVSLISAGTERMLVDFGKSSYLDKARKQPEKVKMVLEKARTDGILQTIDAVRSKLDQPMVMGYSNVGVVVEVGKGVTEFQPGDRVVSNGRHAEMVCVPKHLCARIPDGVADEDAVFTVVGSIALQGIRLTAPTLGECFVVIGLGLIGLMTVQILRANGCRVLGIDFDPEKTRLAQSFGAETVTLGQGDDPVLVAQTFSRGRGVDGVILTAATDSDEPMHQAATMCRPQGRIVLVGVVGLKLQRSDFYEKEISFRVSCSYGPGRYDPSYEEGGNDYPVGYVRWTENRNFEAVLDMLDAGSVSVDALKSQSFDLVDAPKAYQTLLENKSALGILLTYEPGDICEEKTVPVTPGAAPTRAGAPVVVGAIGAGNHAGRTLLPAFHKSEARLKSIASSQGVTGAHYGRKFGFEQNTTDTAGLLADADINTVIVATQHDSHARFVLEALAQGKNAFVEKPLALRAEDLDAIEAAHADAATKGAAPMVMVGFNRRFAPLMQKLKKALNRVEPMSVVYHCNAGAIPADSWVHDPEAGGGRIVGEACHFIDIARFLTGSKITSVQVVGMASLDGMPNTNDTASISLTFENGSIATINYFANGHRSYPKERVEVYQSGGVAVLDNFKSLKGYGMKGLRRHSSPKQDKGHAACVGAFVQAIRNGEAAPIPFDEILEVSRVAVDAAAILAKGS